MLPRLALAFVLVACASTGDGAPDADATDGGEELPDATVDTDSGDGSGPDASLPCEPFEVVAEPPVDPPYSGTAFISDDLITPDDPSAFDDLVYVGQESRTMFDRRTAAFETYDAYLFDATFGTDTHIEIQVNPEFGRDEAEVQARRYAAVVGRMPAFLFASLETFWIHLGMEAFGGGNRNLLIHTGMGESYEAGGELEEIIMHELAHTSMDGPHASTSEWQDAQNADGVAISTYARDNPTREDLAETLGPYLAFRFARDRIDADTANTIERTIPNRIRYLECLGLSMDLLP
ncbi:MAG: hypothetical protein JJ863_17360 [Deltaproteobacteria bacterium]|nr:hypothetical protein [Deltaproteobacteria bacterium]